MPKSSGEKQYNNFVKGLITEASPLTFPENAALDLDNLVLERTGRLSRRLGVDYEVDFTNINTGHVSGTLASSRQSFHRWDSPGGDSSVSLGVVRIYNQLWFLDMLTSAPSSNLVNGGLPIAITSLVNAEIETTVINNNLVVVGSDINRPTVLTYDPATQLVSQQEISVHVRDFWGVDDGLEVNIRPSSLSNEHQYNLRNQGWASNITSTCGTDPLDCTQSKHGIYPSNADIWTLGKIGDPSSASFEKYEPDSLIKNSFDNSPAPKGKIVIDAFYRGDGRAGATSIGSLPIDRELGRFTTLATFANRVFYSGVSSSVTGGDDRSPSYSGFIFFTQISTTIDALGKCYQEADPTSPEISDIIATDGGTIQIPDITKIYKLLSTRTSLLIFAQNGVWELFGDTGGFNATSYQVSKISNIGVNSAQSIIEVNGGVVYWAKAGIFMLTQDDISGRYKAENVSLPTIQTFYNSLSNTCKDNARSFYDEAENRVRWLFNDTADYSTSTFINRYNRELILDLTLGAFYTNTIELGDTLPFICDYVEIPRYTNAAVLEPVFVGADAVMVGADEVVITATTISSRNSQFNFLTLTGSTFTLSKYIDEGFIDWRSTSGGIDYSSYIITGYEIYADLMRKKQIPYLFVFLEKTEDGFIQMGDNLILNHQSSCLVQAQWNWANSDAAGKWGTEFQAYRFKRSYIPSGSSDTFDIGDRVIVTKNKLRGIGRALSLKIRSETGKDLRLLGWSTSLTGNAAP